MTAQAGEQQTETVQQLRGRSKGTADAGDARTLVQGQRSRNMFDLVYLGTAGLGDATPGVGGKGFQVPSRPFRVQRAQRQRGFSGSGNARNGHQFAERNIYVNVFQVMYLCPADDNVPRCGSVIFHTDFAFPFHFYGNILLLLTVTIT